MRRRSTDPALVITTAPESADGEYDRRRRRYAVMMALRAVCVIAAAATYHVSIVLAMVFVAGGLVLPWCAVIIANDGPARKRQAGTGYTGNSGERALPPGDDERVVDG